MNTAIPSEAGWTAAEPADANLVRYHGRNVIGESIDGALPEPVDIAELVRSLYEAGCLALVVSRGGVEVGGIDRESNTGERSWWAEAQTPHTYETPQANETQQTYDGNATGEGRRPGSLSTPTRSVDADNAAGWDDGA